MIPIYEQGGGRGIGHSIESFIERFDEICEEHIKNKRARSFALILYDFTNEPLRKILKDQGVFAKLDRLSSKQLSIFFLHTGNRQTIEIFNSEMIPKLGLNEKIRLPSVIFFRFSNGGFDNITAAELDSADLIHGFGELYDVVENYLSAENHVEKKPLRAVRWIKSSATFLAEEAVRGAIRSGFGHFPF